MMSSAALPKVAFSSPPSAGPARCASCSVARPIMPASGTSDTAAVMNIHGDSGCVSRRIQLAGAARSSRFSFLATSGRPRRSFTEPSTESFTERFDVVFVGAWQQIEERVEAAIERAAQLRDGAVEGVERQAGGGSVGEMQRRFLDAFERAFGNQSNAVDEGVAGHGCDCTQAGAAGGGGGGGRVGAAPF